MIHKCYSNWPTNGTWNKPTNITQIDPEVVLKLIHKCYSIDPLMLLEINPQTLLKLILKYYSNWSKNVIRNKPTNVTKIKPQVLLK